MISRAIIRPITSIVRNNIRLMATATDSDLVLVEEIGDKGILTLNRPKALNACNHDMVHKIGTYIQKWHNTKSLILIKGAGGKAFCAGGDVRTIVEADTSEVGKKFFSTEYVMNYMIGSLKIPYVALIDGITMGGGVGLSVHGKYRIATEKTLFAMPETGIGVYSMKNLYENNGKMLIISFSRRSIPRCGWLILFTTTPRKTRLLFGPNWISTKRYQNLFIHINRLTSISMILFVGADVLHAGVATHYCESGKIADIEKALLALKNSNDVESVINEMCPKPQSEFILSKHLDQINEAFSGSSVEEILSILEKDNSEWAKKTIKVHAFCFSI